MTFRATLRQNRIDAPWVVDGPINGELFRLYVTEALNSTLKPGDIVVLDNLGSYKGGAVRAAIRAARAFSSCHPTAPISIRSNRSSQSSSTCCKKAAEKAVYFAGLLRKIFKDYKTSEGFYRQVLERRGDHADGRVGLAILYQQWANSDEATPEIHAQLSYLIHQTSEALQKQLGKGNDFETYLDLADLYIETSDWAEAREQLAFAELRCRGAKLKRAEMTARRGLICLRSDEHAEAVKNFRQALLVKPEDLTLRSNLGNALLKSKQFEAAQDEFASVLKLAPGNIEALLGVAQVCIDLADDGDSDQYQIAEKHLKDALSHSRNRESGSDAARRALRLAANRPGFPPARWPAFASALTLSLKRKLRGV
jgi:tetratricopeptide (TPR) repeat protein